MKFQPAIKWSGSKRSQSEAIVALMPNEIETYHEPFCGSASVLYQLMVSDKLVKNYIVSDINKDVIDLWKLIKKNPESISKEYKILWERLNKDSNIQRKKKFFEKIRTRFNKEKSPTDFMFIMRTCVNGMPRYNKRGEFNTGFHLTRDGIFPNTLEKILENWSTLLKNNQVIFLNESYDIIETQRNDFIYLDPPYAGTKGMYYGAIDYKELWDFLRKQKGRWALSFDGKTSSIDNTYSIPKNIYKSHEYINSGNSSFRRIVGNSNSEYVQESLYKNY